MLVLFNAFIYSTFFLHTCEWTPNNPLDMPKQWELSDTIFLLFKASFSYCLLTAINIKLYSLRLFNSLVALSLVSLENSIVTVLAQNTFSFQSCNKSFVQLFFVPLPILAKLIFTFLCNLVVLRDVLISSTSVFKTKRFFIVLVVNSHGFLCNLITVCIRIFSLPPFFITEPLQ